MPQWIQNLITIFAPLFGLRDGPIGIEPAADEVRVNPVARGEKEESEETKLQPGARPQHPGMVQVVEHLDNDQTCRESNQEQTLEHFKEASSTNEKLADDPSESALMREVVEVVDPADSDQALPDEQHVPHHSVGNHAHRGDGIGVSAARHILNFPSPILLPDLSSPSYLGPIR